MTQRQQTYAVKVGRVTVGGGAPIVIQSMTNTDTADIRLDRSAVPRARGRGLRTGAHYRERPRSGCRRA